MESVRAVIRYHEEVIMFCRVMIYYNCVNLYVKDFYFILILLAQHQEKLHYIKFLRTIFCYNVQ